MLNKNTKLASRMLNLFVTRQDAYARQFLQKNGTKGFSCVKKDFDTEEIEKHLDNKEHLGVYQLNLDNQVKWGCFDFDKNTTVDFLVMQKLYKFLKEKGFHPLIENSGGGSFKVHIWVFSDKLIPARQMRLFLEWCCKQSGVKSHEIFPKQDEIKQGEFGNLVKLPLGEHLVTKKRSVFLDENFDQILEEDKILEKIEYHFDNKDLISFKEKAVEPVETALVLEEVPVETELKTNEFDKLFNFVLSNNLPHGITKEMQIGKNQAGVNNNVLKNMGIWLFQKGYTNERLEKEIRPIFDDKQWSFGNIKGWFNKAKKGDLKKISRGELIIWFKNYAPALLDTLFKKQEEVYGELELKGFDYFKKLKKPKNDLIESLIPSKTLAVKYSPPKNLKSLTELDACICLASGKKYLGHFKTKKTNCLYVDLENNEFIIKDRWEKLRKFHNIRSKKGLYYLSRGDKVDILSTSFISSLKKAITKYKIGYIVVDTLPKATDYDSNSEREVNRIYTQFFKPLIEEFNCSITFLLHTNKSGSSFIGSQAYHGIVDCSYELNKSKGTTKVKIQSDNRIANINFGVEFIFKDDEIQTYLFDVEQEKTQAISKLKELTDKVRGYFNETSRHQRKDIELRLEEDKFQYGRATLTRVLKFLYEGEFLDRDEKGVYWLK